MKNWSLENALNKMTSRLLICPRLDQLADIIN